ncbi:MAG TPA: PAS domain S-box protein [Puia sp.]|jgi:PAS domain S-box-containing protein|nr:PAS domain S-box protein [Puia sp.]
MPLIANRLKKFWPDTIRGQLVLGIVLVHFALMSVLVLDMVRRQLRFLQRQNQEQTLSLANDLAVNSGTYITGNDYDGLERITLSYRNFPNLEYAMILSPDNVVLAHSDVGLQGERAVDSVSRRLRQEPRSQILLRDDHILDVAAPVFQDDKIVGWARVGVNQDYIYANLMSIIRNGLLYVLAAMVIGVLVALYIGKRLTAALTRLVAAAESIRSGDRSRRAALSGSYEIIRLGAAFNGMLDVLVSNERNLATVLENMPVGAYILQDDRFVFVNPVFAQITGYSRETILGDLRPDLLVHEADLPIARRRYQLRSSGAVRKDHYTLRIIRSDGSVIFVEAIVSRIVYNQRPATIGSVTDITDRLQEENRINKAVIDAQEKERMQIGMELHDHVQQILAGSLLTLDFARTQFDDRALAMDALQDVKGFVNQGIHELRRLSHQLAPAMQTPEGLPEKINELVGSMNATGRLEIAVETDAFLTSEKEELELAIYRIVQEQLNNILKHAGAKRVSIQLKHTDDGLLLSIRDDGKGFDPAERAPGIGLENIRRRAVAMNGELKILSAPGKGCELLLQVPYGGG